MKIYNIIRIVKNAMCCIVTHQEIVISTLNKEYAERLIETYRNEIEWFNKENPFNVFYEYKILEGEIL